MIILPDDLERRFKSEVFKRMGMKKGNITKAIQEAIELWMENVELSKKLNQPLNSLPNKKI
jgi:regulator of replication initiation timing